MVRIDTILAGTIAPLGPRAAPSGIDKHPIVGRAWLGGEGIVGDAQGDRRNHGGPEKAVHHYAFEHYDRWRGELGNHNLLDQPGAFGENLSTTGLTEADVAVGDTFRLGSAIIQVSQGRQPCWKLSARFGSADMALKVQQTGRTGWYYRVIEQGHVEAGDVLDLVDRLSPDWTIERLWRTLYVDTLNRAELAAMAELAPLAEGWRRYAAKRLATATVEDWSARLTGQPRS
ncbi:MAG TPA: MOSC domain-containing protein [Sphingomonas sp.]|nr:MOSC domain-containing protein [Sphingomonas sp.]